MERWNSFAYEWQKGATEVVLIVIAAMAASLYSIPFMLIVEVFVLNISLESLFVLSILIVGPFYVGKNSTRFDK